MMSRLIAVLMALFLAAGATLAQDKKAQTSDDAISDYVRLKLAADPDVKGGALDAVSKDGVVTLTGVLETQKQKEKASKLAKKVKGVKQVVNNITLKDRASK